MNKFALYLALITGVAFSDYFSHGTALSGLWDVVATAVGVAIFAAEAYLHPHAVVFKGRKLAAVTLAMLVVVPLLLGILAAVLSNHQVSAASTAVDLLCRTVLGWTLALLGYNWTGVREEAPSAQQA